jgi:hypothetical protein
MAGDNGNPDRSWSVGKLRTAIPEFSLSGKFFCRLCHHYFFVRMPVAARRICGMAAPLRYFADSIRISPSSGKKPIA